MTVWATAHSIRHVIALVYPNIINVHLAGELQVFPVLSLESGRQTQIEEKILEYKLHQDWCQTGLDSGTHHRFFGY
jgi:hypothetical protein